MPEPIHPPYVSTGPISDALRAVRERSEERRSDLLYHRASGVPHPVRRTTSEGWPVVRLASGADWPIRHESIGDGDPERHRWSWSPPAGSSGADSGTGAASTLEAEAGGADPATGEASADEPSITPPHWPSIGDAFLVPSGDGFSVSWTRHTIAGVLHDAASDRSPAQDVAYPVYVAQCGHEARYGSVRLSADPDPGLPCDEIMYCPDCRVVQMRGVQSTGDGPSGAGTGEEPTAAVAETPREPSVEGGDARHPVDRHLDRVAAHLIRDGREPRPIDPVGRLLAASTDDDPAPPKRKRRTKAEMLAARAGDAILAAVALDAEGRGEEGRQEMEYARDILDRAEAALGPLPDLAPIEAPAATPVSPRRPTVAECIDAARARADDVPEPATIPEAPSEATPSFPPTDGAHLTTQEPPPVTTPIRHLPGTTLELGVPEAEYHVPELGTASSSALKELARSPAHYREWLASPQRPSPSMAFGSAVHCRVLEPAKYAAEYVIRPAMPDGRSAAGKEARDRFAAEAGTRTPVDADDAETIEAMRAALMAHPIASRLLTAPDAAAEVTARWTDAATGVRCRARVDLWVPSLGYAVDIKTTVDASPDGFARSAANYMYGLQQVHYTAGLEACGAPCSAFLFVAVERVRPYGVSVFRLDAEAVEHSRERRSGLLDVMAACLHTDRWPSYSDGIQNLSLPRWALRETP